MNRHCGFFGLWAKRFRIALVLVLVELSLVACGDSVVGTASLGGSGSSFAAPAFAKWQLQFNRQFPALPLNYNSVGSGQGRSDFLTGKTDFGASDVQITAEEAQAAKKNPDEIIQIPLMLGSIVLAFNLSGVRDLNFSPEAVCSIYTGKGLRWNDPKLRTDNPNAALPDAPINLVVRADKSGTTEVFTQYLSTICPDFKSIIGVSGLPDWKKLGLEVDAEPQNAGVGQEASSIQGTLGYLEQDYALLYNLAYANLKNGAGKFVKATKDSISSAVGDTTELNLALLNRPGDNTYPIVTTSYILLNRNYPDRAKGQAVVKLIQYILGEGQQDIRSYAYVGLPTPLVSMAQSKLKQVQAGGEAVLK